MSLYFRARGQQGSDSREKRRLRVTRLRIQGHGQVEYSSVFSECSEDCYDCYDCSDCSHD